MGYYILHDKASGQAQIHYGDCPECRHGYRSSEKQETARKEEWLGPFNSYHDAESAAVKTEANVLDCSQCIP
jgi:hypothetical protein